MLRDVFLASINSFLLLFLLRTWNQNFFCFRAEKFSSAAPNDVPNRQTQRSNQFGVEAAATLAQKPAIMVGGCVFAS